MDAGRERLQKLTESVADAYHRAYAIADRARHRHVGVAHLAVALVEYPEMRRALEAMEVDAEEIVMLVRGMLDEEPRRRWWSLLALGPSSELNAIIQHAISHAWGAELETISHRFLLVSLLRHQPQSLTAERLDAMGVEALPLMLYDAHGRARDTELPEGRGPVLVVAHNDPYTTRELVTELFTTTFGLPSEEAERRMMSVHEEGRGTFRFSEWEAGRARARDAQRAARERGYPLRFSLERAGAR